MTIRRSILYLCPSLSLCDYCSSGKNYSHPLSSEIWYLIMVFREKGVQKFCWNWSFRCFSTSSLEGLLANPPPSSARKCWKFALPVKIVHFRRNTEGGCINLYIRELYLTNKIHIYFTSTKKNKLRGPEIWIWFWIISIPFLSRQAHFHDIFLKKIVPYNYYWYIIYIHYIPIIYF